MFHYCIFDVKRDLGVLIKILIIVLTEVLDEHAYKFTKQVTTRIKYPCFNSEVRNKERKYVN